MLKKILSKKYYFFCLVLSFLVLMCTSKNSFLYEFNDWVDANAFFTMGKSMMNGVVPYKDLFEQKGLLLYVIYGIGYLFCHKAFYGVFILEVFSFSIFLYYAHKIFKMYLDSKYSLVLLPILSYLITTSLAFVHGGSCEEFALPFLMISFYYFFKHFKENKLTNKEVIINGIMAGIVFMMKYTIIGLWIGFGLFIFIDYLRNKEIKSAFKFCLYFFIGVLIPVLLCFIYLILNGALKDYIDCYFIFNMTLYNEGSNASIWGNIIGIPRGAVGSLVKNGNLLTCLVLGIPLFILNIKNERNHKYFRLSLLGICLLTALVLFWGLKFMTYYLLPMFVFLVITLLSISLIFDKYILKYIVNFKYKKLLYIIFIIVPILCVYLSYTNANYRNVRAWGKKRFFQFKYAEYINQYKNPTLLNMGFLDGGLYTTTGIIPNVRYFEVQNIDYKVFPENLDEQNKAVVEGRVKFILFYTGMSMDWLKETNGFIWDKYELVYSDTHYFENANNLNAFLFKLKDLEK